MRFNCPQVFATRRAGTILVVAPDTASGEPAIWDAIMDRLSRAAKRWKP